MPYLIQRLRRAIALRQLASRERALTLQIQQLQHHMAADATYATTLLAEHKQVADRLAAAYGVKA